MTEEKPKKPRGRKVQPPAIDTKEQARRLALGAAMFQALCNETDGADTITALTQASFKAMRLAEQDQVDVVIHCINLLRNDINRALELEKMYGEAAAKMTRALETAEETIMEALKGNNDMPFSGTAGDLKLIGNGGKAPLEGEAVDACRDLHYGNVIDSGTAFELGIPDRFLVPVEVRIVRLNKEAIRTAIEAGETFAFAAIGKRGKRLGGPFIKLGIQDLNEIEGNNQEQIEGGES